MPPAMRKEARDAAREAAAHTRMKAWKARASRRFSSHTLEALEQEKQATGLQLLLSDNPPAEVQGPSGKVYRSKSLFCLQPHHPLRRTCIFVIESGPFDPFILMVIVLNCVTLAWDSPLDPPGTSKQAFLDASDWFFLIVFTSEMLLKVVAYGFVMHEGAYLHDSWCQLDFLVVSLAWLPIIVPGAGQFSAIRSLRALRPLRALNRVPGMPVLVGAIIDAFPRLLTVAGLCSIVLLVFGIVGVELFKGSLHHHCTRGDDAAARADPHNLLLSTEDLCSQYGPADQCGDGMQCLYYAATPRSGTMTLDHMLGACVALLQAISFDDYATIMEALMRTESPWVVLYFVLVIVVCGFVIINLFIAVMFDEFVSAKAAQAQVSYVGDAISAAAAPKAVGFASPPRAASLSDEMQQMVALPGLGASSGSKDEAESSLLPASSVPSDSDPGSWDSGFRSSLRNSARRLSARVFGLDSTSRSARPDTPLGLLVTGPIFQNGAIALVLTTLALMCMSYEGMSEEYADTLEKASTGISLLFVLEMSFKLYALGCTNYWLDNWNALDGIIVIISSIELLAEAFATSSGVKLSFLRMLRLLRLLRILRLMRSWTGLYRVLTSFVKAGPQLVNMFVLMVLTMVIFSLMGMQLFGGQYNDAHGYSLAPCPAGICPDDSLEPLPRFHFNYFGPAMITVFVLLTGKWTDALEPAARVVGPGAIFFFAAVVIIGIYLIMNLFVAILLYTFAEGFVESVSEGTDDFASDSDDDAKDGKRAGDRWRDSYICIGPESWLRRRCEAIVTSHTFDAFIVVSIVASSAALGVDSPRLGSESDLKAFLSHCDRTFIGIFTVECVLKVVHFGLVLGPKAYMKNGWNLLDFFIVAVSWISLIPELSALRTLRVLRPLRLVSRSSGMRLIMTSLFKSLPDVSNVFGVVLIFQLVFAILGMQLFMGSLASCSDPSIATREECVPSRAGERVVWQNPSNVPGSFDDFGQVMMLLYVMSTADDWDVLMFKTMDATLPGRGPVRNDYSPAAMFSIGWMFVGSFFAMNLFVGVIVDNFNRIKKKLEMEDEGGSATMTDGQQKWANALISQGAAIGIRRRQALSRRPNDMLRRRIFDMVESSGFEVGIMIVIVCNVGLLSCDYWGIESDVDFATLYDTMMKTFVHIYYVEAVLKIIAFGSYYFSDGWCQLDFSLVILAAIDEILSYIVSSSSGSGVLRVLRVLRILRILRLLKRAQKLKKLVLTLLLCGPALTNVSALLVLTMYIYAVLGVQLFTFTIHQDQISEEKNFDTLANAALVLFQCLTGDGWAAFMDEARVQEDSGKCAEAQGNCGTSLSIPYFISFEIIGVFIFMNLIVAIMIETFTELGSDPDYSEEIISVWKSMTEIPRVHVYIKVLKAARHPDGELADLEQVATTRLRDTYAWDVHAALYDLDINSELFAPELGHSADDYTSQVHMIRMSRLEELVLKLPPPIGLKGLVASHADARKLCLKLRVTQVNGRVAFKELLTQLLKAKLTGDDVPQQMEEAHLKTPTKGRASPSLGDATSGSPGTPGTSLTLPSSPEPYDDGIVPLSARTVLAYDMIGKQLREKRAAQAAPVQMERYLAASAKRQTTMSKAKSRQRSLGVPEHSWQSVQTGVFFPVSSAKQGWDALIMAFIVYSVIAVPFRVCFEAEAEGWMWYFEVGVTLLFCADIFATFNTAYLENERWIIARKDIAMHYLRGWFWIDLPASIPVELILLLLPAGSSNGAADLSNLKMLRGLRMVRMLRLLKLLKLDEFIAELETDLKVNLKALKIAKMIGALLFLMHLLGCFWFYIALTGGYETSWISEYDDGSGLDKDVKFQYVYSVYWALMTLTTVGYGDITPTNDLERIYTLGALLVGAIVFGYLLSSVGSMMENLDARSNMVESKLDQVQEVIRYTNMPSELASRVRAYTEFYFSSQSVYDVDEVLSHLTPTLDRSVKEFFLSRTVNLVPLLRVYDTSFKLEIMAKIRPSILDIDEVVIAKGAYTQDLTFLRGGEVRAIAADSHPLFAIKEQGRFLGEHELVERACPLTYIASTRCNLMIIGVKTLADVVREHLGSAERLRLGQEVIRTVCRKMRLRYISLRMQADQLEHGQGHGSRRIVAALKIQAAQVRRLARPVAYAAFDFEELWKGRQSVRTASRGRQDTLPRAALLSKQSPLTTPVATPLMTPQPSQRGLQSKLAVIPESDADNRSGDTARSGASESSSKRLGNKERPKPRLTPVETMLYKQGAEIRVGVKFYKDEEAVVEAKKMRRPTAEADGTPFDPKSAAMVKSVSSGSISSEKLFPGDQVLSINGVPVRGAEHATTLLREVSGPTKVKKLPGAEGTAALQRYRPPLVLSGFLDNTDLSAEETLLYKPIAEARVGVFLASNAQATLETHVVAGAAPFDSSSEALIERLSSTSIAQGKLFPGDRIISINGQPVRGAEHATSLLREASGHFKVKKRPKPATTPAPVPVPAPLSAPPPPPPKRADPDPVPAPTAAKASPSAVVAMSTPTAARTEELSRHMEALNKRLDEQAAATRQAMRDSDERLGRIEESLRALSSIFNFKAPAAPSSSSSPNPLYAALQDVAAESQAGAAKSYSA